MANARRHEKAAQLLRLALWASAAADGVTIEEAMEVLSVSRRTAERMRDALSELFQVRELDSIDRQKRWRIEAGDLARLIKLDADTFADLETAARFLETSNASGSAQRLRDVSCALQARLQVQTRNRLAPDVEALIEAEGIALRPGPREVCQDGIVGLLRRALLEGKYVSLDYHSRSTGKLSQGHKLGVLGFLHSPHRLYLVAWSDFFNGERLFALSRIDQAELLDERFDIKTGFRLEAFIENSFGVFQEEPVRVVWRFRPEVAQEAAAFVFHPHQSQQKEDDGSLLVTFNAGGLEEMCWHLFTWGDHVEVLEPPELKARYLAKLQAALERQTTSTRQTV